MEFINRRAELDKLKNEYKQHLKTGKSQVYIIRANSGIGKSEFIKEITKDFSQIPIEILHLDDTENSSTFRRFVIELDKVSQFYGYLDFKAFYTKKINSSKALQLLLKMSSFFGQAFIGMVSKENGIESITSEVNLPSLIAEPREYETFILKAQTENLFEYAKYVLAHENLYFNFPNASIIDQESLDLLNKLIEKSEGSLFIFECADKKVENSFKNSRNIILRTYQLEKLSDEHIKLYINLLSNQLALQAEQINFTTLQDSIRKGDLSEISLILKDFSERLKEDKASKLQNIYQIIENISQTQLVFLLFVFYTKRKLSLTDLREIMLETDKTFSQEDIDFLLEKGLLDQVENFAFLPNSVSEVISQETYFKKERTFVGSILIRFLNLKLSQTNEFVYLDTLVDYYICSKYFLQIKLILPKIQERLLNFDSQQGRKEYFEIFYLNRQRFIEEDSSFALSLAKIAYDANLYYEALEFINLSTEVTTEIIFAKSLILNRCELFPESIKYIQENIINLSEQSSQFFKLSLIKLMNLIQLERRDEAKTIFENIKLQVDNPYYPFLIRVSNIFEFSFSERLRKVEEISGRIYSLENAEFSGLNAIYLSYLYAVNGKINDAEEQLDKARDFFGASLIYNHMILHNEATIKFHNNDIDESIPELLNNAKLTAYDQYDLLAIYNNLLVYYILSDQIADINCQMLVLELEELLNETGFKRFVDKIHYNLYHYYNRMYNIDKSEVYSNKLMHKKIRNCKEYKMRLMYETSWKLPLSLDGH
ncbi:hypothetical protein J5O02_10655 [Streptococcus suis]|uniref:hypothetical protein n=1 Tax=Streptococcus suis TaxID=1307 RepID=UPI0013796706|nr:hypothetical protein [Streptococcus suis]MBO3757473.1 hypothetical protein [Streptococcus suis]